MDGWKSCIGEKGNIESSYSTNDSILKQVHQYIRKDIVLNYMNCPERTYSQRVELDDGSHL